MIVCSVVFDPKMFVSGWAALILSSSFLSMSFSLPLVAVFPGQDRTGCCWGILSEAA